MVNTLMPLTSPETLGDPSGSLGELGIPLGAWGSWGSLWRLRGANSAPPHHHLPVTSFQVLPWVVQINPDDPRAPHVLLCF